VKWCNEDIYYLIREHRSASGI